MVTDKNNPGILDFQDAVEGPLTYDLVSLLKDCYVKWPEEQIERWALSFYDRLPNDLRNNPAFCTAMEKQAICRTYREP